MGSERKRSMRCANGGRMAVVIVLAMISITGCRGVNPVERDFSRGQPAKADVVGKWIPTIESLKQAEASVFPTLELVLREDGSFSAVDLPTSPEVEGASPKGLLSGSGVWHFDKDVDGFMVWIIDLDFASHHRESVHLLHQKPPYLIHIWLGDPDSSSPLLLQRAS
jgi:hypothetical protein